VDSGQVQVAGFHKTQTNSRLAKALSAS
jgi:hypothetical protein